MTTKVKVIISSIALLAAFSFGRWAAPTKVVTEIKTVEVKKQTDTTDTNIKEHKTIVIVQKPDGTKTTTVVDDKNTGTNSTDTTQTVDKSDTTKTVTRDSSKVTLSALGAINIRQISATPAFGGMISKPVLGPITLGVFGLSNGIVGVSLGLTF